MRIFLIVTAWIGIFYSIICAFGILTKGVSSLEFVQLITSPWTENVPALVSSAAKSLFDISLQENMATWISAGLPFLTGIGILALPHSKANERD